MATYTWLEESVESRYKFRLNGGPWHGREVLLTDGFSALMWFKGLRGRYRLNRLQTREGPAMCEWERVPMFGYIATR